MKLENNFLRPQIISKNSRRIKRVRFMMTTPGRSLDQKRDCDLPLLEMRVVVLQDGAAGLRSRVDIWR
jgi:hypothetical protein